MHEKLGPIQLKSAVEHDYLHKRYDRALEGALAYIKVVESGSVKITTAREMCETAVHCAVRLGKFDVAGKLLDKTTASLIISYHCCCVLYSSRLINHLHSHLRNWGHCSCKEKCIHCADGRGTA